MPHFSAEIFSRESPEVLEKKIFQKKKYVQLICADKIFKTVCGNFLKINGSPDI